ncbi:MAG: TonB-dependent receptor [Sphingomonadales bacterium]|nr:TonB-dependent receptor [Sphingomonadales bacterium]MBD3774863.1 TonB-dependent receptor [Paracoccaceae bacterium]
MSKFPIFAGLCVLAVPSAAWAQDQAPGDDCADCDKIVIADLRVAPITVTANGLDTAVTNTGQSVSIIDTREIDSVQGADIARVLARAPGVTLSRSGGPGSVTSVSVRGAGSEQLLVLVDGVPVADPASPAGGFDFGNLFTGMVGKIDLTRGSNSVVWGSDAIGGVMDVATRRDDGFAASAEYGSRNTAFLRGNGGVAGDGYFVGLAGSWYRTDGFSAAAGGTEPDGYDQLALGGSAFVDVTPELEAFVRGEWSRGKLDIDGYPAPAYTLADTAETQRTERWSGAAGLNYYGNDLTLRAAYSIADTSRDYFDPTFGTAPTYSGDGRSQQVLLRGEYRLIGGLALAFGGEHAWSDYATTYDAAARTHSTGGYLQLGWAMGGLAAHLGGRVDDHQRFGTHATFGADISYGLGNDWRLRASLGEGFKAPTLFQLYSSYGNPDLQPEQSTSVDIAVEKGERGRGLHYALTAFRRESEQLIGFAYDAAHPYGVYLNTGRARAQGLEIEANYALSDALSLGGAYSFVATRDKATGRDLARRPRHSATFYADWDSGLGSAWDRGGLVLGADLRLAGRSFDDAANNIRLGGYAVLDLRASFPVTEAVEVFGRVENVFDREYQTVAGYNSVPRGVFAGVRARM